MDGADALAASVRHAGAIFIGRHVPEAIGDYIGGPNHVLPTSRTARFASGLGVLDFMKRTSTIGGDACGAEGGRARCCDPRRRQKGWMHTPCRSESGLPKASRRMTAEGDG